MENNLHQEWSKHTENWIKARDHKKALKQCKTNLTDASNALKSMLSKQYPGISYINIRSDCMNLGGIHNFTIRPNGILELCGSQLKVCCLNEYIILCKNPGMYTETGSQTKDSTIIYLGEDDATYQATSKCLINIKLKKTTVDLIRRQLEKTL